MQDIRKTLRKFLTSAAILALLAAFPLGSNASPVRQPEPSTPTTAPHVDDPNTGEPDVGAHRSQKTSVQGVPSQSSQSVACTLRMLEWSTIVWLRAYFGIGR